MRISLSEITLLVCALGFLFLVGSLFPLIRSLTRASKELEETIRSARETLRKLDGTVERVNAELDGVDRIIVHTYSAIGTTLQTLKSLQNRLLSPSLGVLSMIPALKIGWNFIAKRKKKKSESS